MSALPFLRFGHRKLRGVTYLGGSPFCVTVLFTF